MGIRSLAATLALCTTLASAQAPAAAPPEPELTTALGRLAATATEMERALPSFSCTETGIVEELHGKSVKHHTVFSGTVRALRDGDGALGESMRLTSLDGKAGPGDRFDLPFYVEGGFDQALRYFAPAKQACYRYALSPQGSGVRVDFSYNPESPAACDENSGTTGFALLDANGNVTHVQRDVDMKLATNPRLTAFASVDFAAIQLNGKTYRLSQHLLAETTHGRTTERFDVTYSGCKLYSATFTLSPVQTVNPTDTPPQP